MAPTFKVTSIDKKRKAYSLRALQENLTGYAFVTPAVIIILIFGLFPIVYSLYMSLFNWRILLVTTRETWRPLMVGLWTFVSEAGPETHLLMAGAVITLIPILVIYFLTQKQFTQGIATTGLKG